MNSLTFSLMPGIVKSLSSKSPMPRPDKGYASFDRPETSACAKAIDELIESHSSRSIFDMSELVTGEDQAYYRLWWKNASKITVKQGIKNRVALLGW